MAFGTFVGREELLASVVENVGAHRLVTLTGVGGVGKTRLAVEVAATIGPRFRDGAWMVDLAAVGDAAAVPDAIASALGINPQAETPMSQTLINALSRQHLLLVLDNCEHVLRAAAGLAELLVARSDGPRILATFRERLQVSGEHEVPVLPLTLDDPSSPAVVLFAERARSVRPNFSLDDHPATITAVLEICRRLDGLPLGIELAAARMAGMSVTDVRDRLDDRFRLLAGRPGAPQRQQSLPELVRWSYDLLDDAEREVLRQAAVFVGGFDLAAFRGVFGNDDDTAVLRALDRLVRSSLVVAEHADGRVRYRLLETIRQFGVDELTADDALDSSRDRHARWFAGAVVAQWASHNGPCWDAAVEWLRTELADLRAAFRWAADCDLATAVDIAAHAGLIGTSANLFEPISWAESVVDAAAAADLPRLPRLLCACGYACFVGRPVAAAAYAEQAMRLEAEPGYESCEPGLSAFVAALANVYAGRLDRYIELATIADGFGGAALAFARPALVDGLQASGRLDEALEVANPFWLAYALWIAGITRSKVDPPRALAAWDEGLAVVREHRVDFFRGFLARDAARLHTTAGEADAALSQFDVAIESFHRAGNIAQLIITLASLPELLARLGEPAAAATLHAAMVKIPASVDHVPELADLGGRLATDGLTTREIAARLFISAKTADRHIQNIYTKIGTSTRATATRWALDNGLLAGTDR